MLITDKILQVEGLSESEAVVAQFICMLKKNISRSSTRSIAEATFTSPATVIRLCKKLGFKGFEELKNEYLQELDYLEKQIGSLDVNYPFERNDTEMKAANKISALYLETVQDTMSLLKYPALKSAETLIKCSSSIHIFSYGTTLNIAESFREKMLKIGKKVFISSNLNYQLYEASALGKGDLAILISYSGETQKILQIAQTCKDRKVPMIIMTSFGENSLSSFEACKLVISTKESLYRNLGDYSTHVSVGLLLDILYTVYFLQNYDSNYNRKIELADIYEGYRKSTNSILNNEINNR